MSPASGSACAAGPSLLIGFAESLAAPEVTWSLLDTGFRVIAFTRRGRRPALRRLGGVELHEIEAPELNALLSVQQLASLVTSSGAAAVMPLDDAALWLCDRAARDHDLIVVGPIGQQAEIALDKRRQLELAAPAGFLVPQTVCTGAEPIPLTEVGYPAIVKPAMAAELRESRLARGRLRIYNERSALEAAIDTRSSPQLIQTLLDGVGEGLFGLGTENGAEALSAHRRLRMMNPKGSGSSACRAIPVEKELARAADAMVRSADWRGMFMIELLRDRNGLPWFMEFNGRAWGSMALARRMGFEYPAWAAADRLGFQRTGECRKPTQWVTCRHLGRELVHVLAVMRGPSGSSARWPSRWKTLLDVARVRKGERWYNWRSGAFRFFVDDTYQTVKQQVISSRSNR